MCDKTSLLKSIEDTESYKQFIKSLTFWRGSKLFNLLRQNNLVPAVFENFSFLDALNLAQEIRDSLKVMNAVSTLT